MCLQHAMFFWLQNTSSGIYFLLYNAGQQPEVPQAMPGMFQNMFPFGTAQVKLTSIMHPKFITFLFNPWCNSVCLLTGLSDGSCSHDAGTSHDSAGLYINVYVV